jgi:hypothetical protein
VDDTLGSLGITELNEPSALVLTTLTINDELGHRDVAEFFEILFQLFLIDVEWQITYKECLGQVFHPLLPLLLDRYFSLSFFLMLFFNILYDLLGFLLFLFWFRYFLFLNSDLLGFLLFQCWLLYFLFNKLNELL